MQVLKIQNDSLQQKNYTIIICYIAFMVMLNIHRHNHKAATIGHIVPSGLCSMQEQQLVPQSSSVARRILSHKV